MNQNILLKPQQLVPTNKSTFTANMWWPFY